MLFHWKDWRGWCMRIKKEVFNREEFKIWTDENIILLNLDFPRRKKIDPKILNQNRDSA